MFFMMLDIFIFIWPIHFLLTIVKDNKCRDFRTKLITVHYHQFQLGFSNKNFHLKILLVLNDDTLTLSLYIYINICFLLKLEVYFSELCYELAFWKYFDSAWEFTSFQKIKLIQFLLFIFSKQTLFISGHQHSMDLQSVKEKFWDLIFINLNIHELIKWKGIKVKRKCCSYQDS